ncbi:MAG TPA: hypothetical protein ENF75_06495 [Acidilobales archaeon]|nr:hypothetical protein [Acidilobales archaeon]
MLGVDLLILLVVSAYVAVTCFLLAYAINKFYVHLKGTTLGHVAMTLVLILVGFGVAVTYATTLTYPPIHRLASPWVHIAILVFLGATTTTSLILLHKIVPKHIPLEEIKEYVDYVTKPEEMGYLPNINFIKVLARKVKQKELANYLTYMLGRITAAKLSLKYEYIHKAMAELIPELAEEFGVKMTFNPATTSLRVSLPLRRFNVRECELVCFHFQGFWEEFISRYLHRSLMKSILDISMSKDEYICEIRF